MASKHNYGTTMGHGYVALAQNLDLDIIWPCKWACILLGYYLSQFLVYGIGGSKLVSGIERDTLTSNYKNLFNHSTRTLPSHNMAIEKHES